MKEAESGLKNIQSLFKSKELYEILIANSSDAIFFTENSQIIDCNEAAVLLFGFSSKEDFKGKSPFDFSPDRQPDGTLSKEKAQQSIAESYNKKSQQVYWKLLKCDGTLFDATISLNYFEHENHSFHHFSIFDISLDKNLHIENLIHGTKYNSFNEDETKLSDEKLNQSLPIGRVWSFRETTDHRKIEEQLYLMAHTIKSIKETITITDMNDRLLFVNAAFLKTYGYTEEEVIGQHISIIRSPGNDPGSISQLMKSNNSPTWQGEFINRKKDGSDILISLSTSMVKNDLGEVIGMVGVAVDITPQKQAEIELKNSEERLRNLIHTMPDGVYRSTPEGKFIEVNPAMIKMLGYETKEELLDVDITSQLYFDPADRQSAVLEEELEEMGIFRMKKKDGSEVWVEDHGWYVTDENGKIIFHEGVSRDITERRQDEVQLQKYSDELKELNATKDKFFSIIAHDLKSPFNSISGLSEIIKNEAGELDLDTIKQYAGIIHSTSLQTFRLLENLLDWARLQQSQIIFRPVSVVLKDMIDEVFELMIEKAQNKKIELLNFVPAHLLISADQDMLKTILRNLVSNALKFTSTHGKVEISATVHPDEIQIIVVDSGIGIKKEVMDKLFKVDSIFSEQGTDNETGTGLGLMICKEFIEKHNGRIWVESEAKKGSAFNFTLSQK